MVLFALQQRGRADDTGIYVMLWLSRVLLVINELTLYDNSPFIMVAS